MYPKTIQKLIDRFSRFPTVGPRTAARFVFYLLKLSPQETEELIYDIQSLREHIILCSFCFNSFEKEQEEQTLCTICQNSSRKATLCIVEKESDLETLEKTGAYQGVYFVLGGTVGALKKEDIQTIPMEELKKRVEKPNEFGLPYSALEEIIIATNPTTEGEATALYLERTLKSLTISVTRLARGLPVGAELEYSDEETLRSSLENRK